MTYKDPGFDLVPRLLAKRAEINDKRSIYIEEAKLEKAARHAQNAPTPSHDSFSGPPTKLNPRSAVHPSPLVQESQSAKRSAEDADLNSAGVQDVSVVEWLQQLDHMPGHRDKNIRFSEYAAIFEREKVFDLDVLNELGREALKELGIPLGPAVKIEKWVKVDVSKGVKT